MKSVASDREMAANYENERSFTTQRISAFAQTHAFDTVLIYVVFDVKSSMKYFILK